MPNLVEMGLRIQDYTHRRTLFKRVPVGQIFHCDKRWWYKHTTRTAVPADEISNKPVRFKYGKAVRVFDETAPSKPKSRGLTYEEFMNSSAL